jgi:hypothetical protein
LKTEYDDLGDLDLDEDGILGNDACASYVLEVKAEPNVASQSIEESERDELDYDEDEDAKTPVEDELDDESEDEDSGRDKFRSERAVTSNVSVSRAIPDSLDDVQLKPETFPAYRNGRGRGRGRVGQQKVLINPQYMGSVTQQPNSAHFFTRINDGLDLF